jgi:hypothetical protein
MLRGSFQAEFSGAVARKMISLAMPSEGEGSRAIDLDWLGPVLSNL